MILHLTTSAIGFFGFLTLIFITLKLSLVGAVASWSWWQVLSPIWIPVALFVVIAMCGGVSKKRQSAEPTPRNRR